MKINSSVKKNKSAADFAASPKVTRQLFEMLVECGGPPSFGQRGASFRVRGKVLARLELRGCPRPIVKIDDDVLWISVEAPVANKLPATLMQKMKEMFQPLVISGKVNLHIAVNCLSQTELAQVRKVLSECFGAE